MHLHAELASRSKARANNAFRVLRAVYNWHLKRTVKHGKPTMPPNPVLVLSDTHQWSRVRRKKTVIRREGMPAWAAALERMPLQCSAAYAQVCYLLFRTMLFTGLRSGELRLVAASKNSFGGQAKGYYSMSEHLIYLVDQKNHIEMEIPLSAHVELKPGRVWLFEGSQQDTLPYASIRTCFGWVNRFAGQRYQPHDLRRTFITVAEGLDISPYTIKRLVGHKTQDSLDVTGGYIAQSEDRLRAAAQRIGDTLRAAMSSAG